MNQVRLVLHLSLRNLWAHKVKSLIVGSLMIFGALLVVFGTAMLDSVENAISRSVIHSLAGHFQIYSAKARDELAIYGGTAMSGQDYGVIPRFSEIKDVVEKVPNVRAVVPMGINLANMTRGSDLDRAFARLRDAHRRGDTTERDQLIPRIERMLKLLELELDNGVGITGGARKAELQTQLLDVRKALAPGFWDAYRADPIGTLEFLDTRIAPAGGEGRLMYLRYVGTDLTAFAKYFDRFKLVKGEMVPPGQRGILINQKFADVRLKLLAARLFDDLEEGRLEGLSVERNSALRSKARRLSTQAGSISLMLGPADVADLTTKLRAHLQQPEAAFDALLESFLNVDDKSLEARFRLFYDELAPRIELYPFKVGDVVTIRAWTRTGYAKAANVKVWGTFSFRGLERSDLSGAANLVDMMTFRTLYGQMSAGQKAELETIRKDSKVKTVSRENAEAAFFGGDDDTVEVEDGAGFSEFEGLSLKRTRRTADADTGFTQKELDDGLVLSAAVLMEDETLQAQTETAIAAALKAAKLDMQVVDWQKASGMLGQAALLVRGILYIAIFIIFGVALVIINNSMLMATLERVREIGTLRAIGAQRNFILWMLLVETVTLCVLSGGLGTGLAVGLLAWLGDVGIPALNDIMVFIFSGSRLFPEVALHHAVTGFVIILIVSLFATIFPARLATRIQPIEAMQSRD